ncbi:hypothetical protein DFA_02271 [Cavenderia fasciculata]|uniref:DNA2/NAM7 helicase-like C-terminal domain-containing protein n=1 Tax=Cavenderia fasciculata TaxID=261658 RepID=F4PYZ9_CACFS|nr:uncharacterized protein DFA_02271 [Cavenderia fasciculata]EGG19028.1 hypothetical protein DFA_02271 [Cavenderia fasciculata]|eukprot:XP_004366661.1 hypothetical protein DFA_02271 [Cavenderia fasciculata]
MVDQHSSFSSAYSYSSHLCQTISSYFFICFYISIHLHIVIPKNKSKSKYSSTTMSKPRRNRSLNTLIEDGLVDTEATWSFTWSDVTYTGTITKSKGHYCFSGAQKDGLVITEHASTTFIRNFLALDSSTIVDGNKIMFVNNKRISDYVLLESPSSSTTSTPTSNNSSNNNNNVMTTPTRDGSVVNLIESFKSIGLTLSPPSSITTPPSTPFSSGPPRSPASVVAPNSKLLSGNSNSYHSNMRTIAYQFYREGDDNIPLSPVKDNIIIPATIVPSSPTSTTTSTTSTTSTTPTTATTLISTPTKKEPIKIEYEDSTIKASGIGRYFHLDCERYFNWSTKKKSSSSTSSTPSSSSSSSTSTSTSSDNETISNAIIQDGFAWEDKVLEILIQEKHKIHQPVKGAQTIPFDQVVKLLKEEKENSYIVQATLIAPISFRQNIPDHVKFTQSIPDFLRIGRSIGGGKRKLKILDAKSTASIHFAQKVQLAYYYIWLQGIIESENITDLELDDFGAIFLKGLTTPMDFNILEPVRLLKRFLYGDKTNSQSQMVKIISTPREESVWRLTETCEGCEYLEQCTAQANSELNHNAIANVQIDTITSLLEYHQQKQDQSTTPTKSAPIKMNEIEKLNSIKVEDVDDPQLKVQLLRLKPKLQTVLSNTVVPTGYVDVMLPSYEDISIYLSLVSHPLKQTFYKWTILKVENSISKTPKDPLNIDYQSLSHNTIFYNGENFYSLILKLNSIFSDAINTKSTLQVFTWDAFEKSYFLKSCYELLKRSYDIDDKEMQSNLVHVMGVLMDNSNWINFNIGGVYPQEPFSYNVGGQSQGSGPSNFPFILVKDQILKSLAIKVSPPFSIGEISKKVLSLDTIPSSLNSDYIFNNYIKKDHKDKEENVVFNERTEQLFNLMAHLRSILFTDIYKQKSQKFNFRKFLNYNNILVNKLLYCHQFESMESYREIKSARSNPLSLNIYDGKYLILRKLSNQPNKDGFYRFQADIIPQYYSYFQQKLADAFSHFCLTPNTQDGLNFLSSFNDISYQSQYGVRGMCDISDFEIDQVEAYPTQYLFNAKISIKPSKNSNLFNDCNSNEFILFERFDNHFFSQYKWLVQGYDSIDSQGTEESTLLGLFDKPLEWIREEEDYKKFSLAFTNTIEAFNQTSSNHPDQRLTLTKSQREIAISVVQRRLQLVRGPPGTGKTHFLALLVLMFFETIFRMKSHDTYTIVISALTHTAIDNALIRIAQLKKEYEGYAGSALPFHIYKKENKPLAKELVEQGILEHKQLDKKTCPRFIVVGATCWGVNTYKNPIDFLIIDEASQLQTPIAALAINKAPRVVVCGDPKQLPPVLHGTYHSNKSLSVDEYTSDPKVHKSIFSCLKGLLRHHLVADPFLSLNENFRMTSDLCQFSSLLYGPSYRCAETGAREFNIHTLQQSKEWKDLLSRSTSVIQGLYGDHRSCHSIVLDTKYLGNRRVEVELVREIYRFELGLFKSSRSSSTTSASELEDQFWKSKQLGIITPLNMQRIDMQSMISSEQYLAGSQEFKPSVGTVEKMQGQEFDTVVVCYNGWNSGSGKTLDFIFNLNRLNVGFTRSKTRLILIISESLLRPNQLVLNNAKTSKAYNHLLNYVQNSSIHKFIIKQTNIYQKTPIRDTTPTTPTTPISPFNFNIINNNNNNSPSTPNNNNQTNNIPSTPETLLQQEFIRKLNLNKEEED